MSRLSNTAPSALPATYSLNQIDVSANT